MRSLSGLKTNFTILDTDDQVRLLKQLIVAANIDEKRWPARQLAGHHRPLEEPRLDAREGPGGRGRGLQPARRRALRAVPGAAQDAQRGRFRRPALHVLTIFQTHEDVLRAVPALVPLHPRGRVPGHERRPVPLAAASGADPPQHLLRGRRRPVDLRLARCGGRQHPAVREGLPRRQGHPARTELPLDAAHPRRRLGRSSPRTRGALARPSGPRRTGARRSGSSATGTARRRRAGSARSSRRWGTARGGCVPCGLSDWPSSSAPPIRCARSRTGS